MQGSVWLCQRLSLQCLPVIQSYRTRTLHSGGFCSLPVWQVRQDHELGADYFLIPKTGTKPGPLRDLALQRFGTVRIMGSRTMRSYSFPTMSSNSQRIGFIPLALRSRVAVVHGDFCHLLQNSMSSIQRPIPRHAGLQCWSIQVQRGYARKPYVRVAANQLGHDQLGKREDVEFKRNVLEQGSVTTFSDSDLSSVSEDDEGKNKEKEEKMDAAAYVECTSNHIEDDEGQHKEMDKKVKKLMKKEKKAKVDVNLKYECEQESDSEREDDETEEKRSKAEKKRVQAQSKLEEQLDKDTLKALKKAGKKRKEEEKNSKAVMEEQDDLDEVTDDDIRDLVSDVVEDDGEELEIIEDGISGYEFEEELVNEFEDELDDLDKDDEFWEEEEGDVVVGDGGDGGGVVLGEKEWGPKALELAQQVLAESGNDLTLFAFKSTSDGIIRIRLDKLSDRYGSPTMSEIELFSRKLTSILNDLSEAGAMPKDVSVEVSSPGAERVVRVPEDLERFQKLPMYVQYVEGEGGTGHDGHKDMEEKDGVLVLESLDRDASLTVWKVANVKVNRDLNGKGRPLSSKQKKWRGIMPFTSLKQVRLYMDM